MDVFYSNGDYKIKDIKTSSSSDTNNIFVCFYYEYEYCHWEGWDYVCTDNIVSECLIYDVENKQFKEIIYIFDMNNIEIFYYSETKKFIIVSNDYINFFRIYNMKLPFQRIIKQNILINVQ